jgi:hypothetical protein
MPQPKKKSKQSPTNATTLAVRGYLFVHRVPAWRSNVLPVPVVRDGQVTGFRPGSKPGVPDICGIIPAGLLAGGGLRYGNAFFCEVKTGRDKLRPVQVAFIADAERAGAVVLVVKDFEDFLMQWKGLPWLTAS